MKTPKPGTIGWIDLTIRDADRVRDFYAAVTGWKPTPVSMGPYNDYCMAAPRARKPAAGICHARGVNKNLPPHWLIYITVADLSESLRACVKAGGKVVCKPRDMGNGRMAVIRDPAGAVAGLYQFNA